MKKSWKRILDAHSIECHGKRVRLYTLDGTYIGEGLVSTCDEMVKAGLLKKIPAKPVRKSDEFVYDYGSPAHYVTTFVCDRHGLRRELHDACEYIQSVKIICRQCNDFQVLPIMPEGGHLNLLITKGWKYLTSQDEEKKGIICPECVKSYSE